jgi:autoinducer 2-degrading protein
MTVTCVNIRVKSEHINDFIRASLENHKNSILEEGNLRFDILQNASDPSRFTLYEAYRSEEDAAAHKNTAHYAAWRDTVAAWMAEPREGVKHNVLAPTDISLWK